MSTVFLVSGIAFLIAGFSLTVAYWGELSNRRWEAQREMDQDDDLIPFRAGPIAPRLHGRRPTVRRIDREPGIAAVVDWPEVCKATGQRTPIPAAFLTAWDD